MTHGETEVSLQDQKRHSVAKSQASKEAKRSHTYNVTSSGPSQFGTTAQLRRAVPCPQPRAETRRPGPPLPPQHPAPQPRLPQRGEPPAGCSPRDNAASRAPRPPPSAGATCTPRPPPPAAPHGAPNAVLPRTPLAVPSPEPARGSASAAAGDSDRGASGAEFRTATFVPSPGSGENAKGAPNRCLTSPGKESRS
ncbi:uncharacterized protein LOC116242160 [Phasianus colchicus]|uniref:uncharacterized protein LOC116242160 n=1 Tax=Phasianus colchicus TaxID=9054 RepID=UPI00129D50CF|nr:uncharacterized protein LOC116242160 [Phasianus colchicus]